MRGDEYGGKFRDSENVTTREVSAAGRAGRDLERSREQGWLYMRQKKKSTSCFSQAPETTLAWELCSKRRAPLETPHLGVAQDAACRKLLA